MRKNPTICLIIAIVTFVLAVSGFWYSLTDNAKFIGEWVPTDSLNKSTSDPNSSYQYIVEFTIFGTFISTSDSRYNGDYNSYRITEKAEALYSLETDDHILVHGFGTRTNTRREADGTESISTHTVSPSLSQYYFLNGNKELLVGSAEGENFNSLTRRSALPFYLLLRVGSVLLAIIGGIFIWHFLQLRKNPEDYGPISDDSTSSKKSDAFVPIVPGNSYYGIPPRSIP